jgi:uncharacterized protein with NRDE domain
MCTLVLWWRVFPDAEVVIAANRDEHTARPFDDPADWAAPPIFAGRDGVAGGTWLGVGPGALAAGITNRWEGSPPDPNLPSRGAIVVDALSAGSADAAVAALTARALRTNGYGLLVADRSAAFRVDGGEATSARALTPGITVLANWRADEPRPRTERALALARAVPTSSVSAALPAIEKLLGDHDGSDEPGRAICVHGDHYATVCSTVIALGGTPLWRDLRGNPCRGAWRGRTLP